jgi:hypothetical protein
MMKKMSAAGVAAVMIASQTMAGDAVQWRVEDGGNGHWYEVSNLGPTMTGDSARQHAADRGGYLLSITSLEEDNFVQTIVTDLNVWGNEFLGPMIGMHRDGGDCWNGCWDSGEVVGYTHWHPGNPDGSLERCVYLYRYGICEWQDYACDLPGWGSRAVSAVVEWSADCNNDGIVDYGQCQDGTLADYNSNNIPDCCERGEACVIGSYPVQWPTIDGGNGHWYMLQRNGSYLCWSTATAFARAVGGYLASETTEAEHSFVSGRLVARDDAWSGRWGPWIGGLYAGGRWTWTSGEPWNFTAWQPGEPNGAMSETVVSYIAQGEGGNCGRTATWNDWVDCGTAQASGCDVGVWNYIIEWSADCNNDGIVDYGQIRIGQLADTNNNGVPDTCECIGDIDTDGTINGSDLGIMLAYWGTTSIDPASIACDLNVDGVVNGSDLGILLASWGPCNL